MQRQLHRRLPARHQLIPRKLLTTLMNKAKTPLLPLHLLIQVNHRKRKLPFQLYHQSWWWTPNHMFYMLYEQQRANVLENPPSMTRENLWSSMWPLSIGFHYPNDRWDPTRRKSLSTQSLLGFYWSFLKMMHLCVHLSGTQPGGYSSRELRGRKWGFPFHLVWCFASFSALATSTRCLCTKKELTHFTSKSFATILVLRPNSKNGVSHFTPLVFCMFRAGSVHAVLVHKTWVVHFSTAVFCRTVSCSNQGVNYSLPPLQIAMQSYQFLMGGLLRSLWLASSCHFGSLRWGVNFESTCAKRVNEGFRFSLKLTTYDWMPHFRQSMCTLCVLCESELLMVYAFLTCWFIFLMPVGSSNVVI